MTGCSSNFIKYFFVKLNKVLSLKDLGELSFFLGIEVLSTSEGFRLFWAKYIWDLLDKVQLKDSKSTTTSTIVDHALSKIDIVYLNNPILYQTIIDAF